MVMNKFSWVRKYNPTMWLGEGGAERGEPDVGEQLNDSAPIAQLK